jgi:hypothetical protein
MSARICRVRVPPLTFFAPAELLENKTARIGRNLTQNWTLFNFGIEQTTLIVGYFLAHAYLLLLFQQWRTIAC